MFTIFIVLLNIVKEHIDFQRGLDPKDAMGIGIESELNNWLKSRYSGNLKELGLQVALKYVTIDGNFDFVKYLVEVKGAEITNDIVNASFFARKNGVKYSGPIEPVRTYLIAGGNPDTIDYLSRKIEQARKMK